MMSTGLLSSFARRVWSFVFTALPVCDVFVYMFLCVQVETPAGDMMMNARKTVGNAGIHSVAMMAKAGAMAIDGVAAIDLAKRSIDVKMNYPGGEILCDKYILVFTVMYYTNNYCDVVIILLYWYGRLVGHQPLVV